MKVYMSKENCGNYPNMSYITWEGTGRCFALHKCYNYRKYYW